MISPLITHPLLISALLVAQACTQQAPKAPSDGSKKGAADGSSAGTGGGSAYPPGGGPENPPGGDSPAYQPPASGPSGNGAGSGSGLGPTGGLGSTNGITPITATGGSNNQKKQTAPIVPMTPIAASPIGSQVAGSTGTSISVPVTTQTPADAAAGKALVGNWTGTSDQVASGVSWNIKTISSKNNAPSTGTSTSPGGIKKGLGMWGTAGTAGSKVGASWYYNWKTAPNMGDSGKLEYVPMLWGPRDNNDNGYAQIKSAASPNVLGPNEPDRGGTDGSAMSPEEVIALWPKLIATGKRLGSPVVASDYNWLDRFMQQAQSKGYKVDFIAVHHYPNALDLNEVDAMRKTLTDLHTKYGKPIWYTEFGICSFATHGAMSDAQKQAFINKMLEMLESLDFVERYAWFSDRSFSSCEDSAIYSGGNNDLTATGNAYKAAGQSAAP